MISFTKKFKCNFCDNDFSYIINFNEFQICEKCFKELKKDTEIKIIFEISEIQNAIKFFETQEKIIFEKLEVTKNKIQELQEKIWVLKEKLTKEN